MKTKKFKLNITDKECQELNELIKKQKKKNAERYQRKFENEMKIQKQ